MPSQNPDWLRPTNHGARWAEPFWQGLAARELRAQRCRGCDERMFPPRTVCPACLGNDLEWFALSGRGTLHSWTEIHMASPEFTTPFLLGLVDLEGDTGDGGIGRLTAMIAGIDADELAIDMPVRIDFVEREPGVTMYRIIADGEPRP